MVYIHLPAAYHRLDLDVAKENLLAAVFSAVSVVFLALSMNLCFLSEIRHNAPNLANNSSNTSQVLNTPQLGPWH